MFKEKEISPIEIYPLDQSKSTILTDSFQNQTLMNTRKEQFEKKINSVVCKFIFHRGLPEEYKALSEVERVHVNYRAFILMILGSALLFANFAHFLLSFQPFIIAWVRAMIF